MLDALQTKMDSVVTKLDNMITNLQAVNTSVSQTLNRLVVQASFTATAIQAIAVGNVSATGNGTDGGVKVNIGTIKMFCDGSVNFYFILADNASVSHGGVWYNKNNSGWVKAITATNSAPTPYSVNLDVAYGDTFVFAVGGWETAKVTTSSNGIIIRYDIINLISHGAYSSFAS
jgi:co-chaperonin GroES (HSP10)